MKEETATDEIVATSGEDALIADDSQPDDTIEAAGESEETQPDQSETEEVEETPEDSGTTDEDLAWAEKKGIDLSDPKKVASILRNADRKVSEAGKNKSKMEQEVNALPQSTDPDPIVRLEQRYALLEAKQRATEFYVDHPDYRTYDAEAATILNDYKQSDPEYAQKLANNLPDLFALARQRHETKAVAEAKKEGRIEERKALASKQRASTVSPAATTQDTPKKDAALDAFNAEFEY